MTHKIVEKSNKDKIRGKSKENYLRKERKTLFRHPPISI